MNPGHRHRLAHHLAEQCERVLERESNDDRTEMNARLVSYARRLRGALEVAMTRDALTSRPMRTGALTADPMLTSAPTNEGE